MDDRLSIPDAEKEGNFHFALDSRPALGPTESPIQWVPGGKASGAWSWPPTSISAEIKNAWSYTSTLPIRLHGVTVKHGNFTFTFTFTFTLQ